MNQKLEDIVHEPFMTVDPESSNMIGKHKRNLSVAIKQIEARRKQENVTSTRFLSKAEKEEVKEDNSSIYEFKGEKRKINDTNEL